MTPNSKKSHSLIERVWYVHIDLCDLVLVAVVLLLIAAMQCDAAVVPRHEAVQVSSHRGQHSAQESAH